MVPSLIVEWGENERMDEGPGDGPEREGTRPETITLFRSSIKQDWLSTNAL